MSTSTYRVTFHVLHPNMPADEIKAVFNLPTRYSQSFGMQRKAKSGTLLTGVYARTSVCFLLHDEPLLFNEFPIIDFILKQISSYDRDFLERISETGGTCHFLCGIFSSENVMFELNAETISLISSANVGLKFDFYGGEP